MSQQGDLIGGRYRLEEHLGSGGMGHVWLAWDERLSRAVALKQLRAVPDLPEAEVAVAHERAMREARLTARLDHPNAVRVYDVVDHHGEPCLVMQYVPSRSLHELLSSDGALPPRRVARLGVEIASALAAAHAAHIVHRDVKPGNVLVTVDGTALITDFGISRAFGDAALTSTGLLTGTPAYLAPEIARGEGPTPSSDVFSLGSTLYTAVEGIPPFGVGENPMALLHQVAQGRITPPTQAGPLTDTLVAMLDPDPRPRPTMEQVALEMAQVEAAAARELAPTVPQTRHSTAVLPVTPQPFEEEVEPDTGNLAPTPAAVPVRAPAPDPAPPPARGADVVDPRRRRRRRALGLGAVAVLLVLLTAWALSNLMDPSGGTAPPIAASSTTPLDPRSASSEPTSEPTSERASEPTSAATSESPSSATPRPSGTTPSASASRAPATPAPSAAATSRPAAASSAVTAGDLSQAVRNYYALVPGDTDSGWALLTDRYRRTTATSRDYYERFWSSIEQVQVSDVSSTAPSSVVATLRYSFRDGRTVVERTAYGLVREDGRLKIDRSSVLSSRAL